MTSQAPYSEAAFGHAPFKPAPRPGDLSRYSISNATTYHLLANNTFPGPTIPCQHQNASDVPGTSYLGGYSRHPFPETFNNVSQTQRLQLNPPCNTTHALTSTYADQDVTPGWTSLPATSVQTPGGWFCDENIPPGYGSSSPTHLTSSGSNLPALKAGEPSRFPGLSPLATHLPKQANDNDRILPNPARLRSSLSNNHSLTHASSSDIPTNFSLPTGKDSDTWDLDRGHSETSHGSMASCSRGTTRTSASSPDDVNDAPSFGYTQNYICSGASTGGYSAIAPTTVDPTTTLLTSTASGTSNNLYRYSGLPTLNAPSNFPSYPMASRKEMGSTIGSMGAEVSTKHGQRILQPKPRHSRSHEASLSGKFEASAKQPRKSSKGSCEGLP